MRAIHQLPALAPTPLALGLNENASLSAARGINPTNDNPLVYLRSRVKDDDIEWKLGRFQVRADHERTHHPARLESDESIRHTSEKLSQRQVSLLLVDFGRVARLDPPATLDVPRLRSLLRNS